MAAPTAIEALIAYLARISEGAQHLSDLAELQHRVVHGGLNESIVTESGLLSSIAKWQYDNLLPSKEAFAQLRALVDAMLADPQNAVTSWDVQAKGFDLVQGSATYGVTANRLAAWQLPKGSASYLAMPLTLPSHWTKMDVYLGWVNTVANAGNVVLGGELHQWAPGESMNVTPGGSSSIVTANPTPFLVTESKIAADLIVDPSRTTTLRIARQGASANDTLVNSISFLKVRLQKKN
jgi:hypothetical protein